MSRTFNATMPVIRVEQSTISDTHNEYAELDSIRELAKCVCSYKPLVMPVCNFVSTEGFKLGYARLGPGQDSAMVNRLRTHERRYKPVSGINAAIKCSLAIADEFHDAATLLGNPDDLPGKFTSAISEAIVSELFGQSTRGMENIVKDAIVFEDNKRLYSRNIDFFYADDPPTKAEAYECKNSPSGIFSEAIGLLNAPDKTKRIGWKKSKLYLMRRLKRLLEAKRIPTHLALISLLSKVVVEDKLEQLAANSVASIPKIVSVYAREDIFAYIPCGHLKPIS